MIKDQEVLLLLSVHKTLSLLSSDSSCLQLLPAQKELNWNQEISRRGREDLVGRTVLLLRHSHLPARPEKVVLVEVGRGKERVSNTFLSFFAASLPLKPIPKVRITFSSVSVVEGTTGICSHLSFGAFEEELCLSELSGWSLISSIYRGAAHTLQ